MWMLIFFVAIFFMFSMIFIHGYAARWRGRFNHLGKWRYYSRVYSGADCKLVKLGMEASPTYDFVVRPHTRLDHLLDWCLRRIPKTIAHARFDRELRLISDDYLASQAFAGSPELAEEIVELFENPQYTAKKLICRQGKIWLLLEAPKSAVTLKNTLSRRLRKKLVTSLAKTSAALGRYEGVGKRVRYSRLNAGALVALSVSVFALTQTILTPMSNNSGNQLVSTDLMPLMIFIMLLVLAVAFKYDRAR